MARGSRSGIAQSFAVRLAITALAFGIAAPVVACELANDSSELTNGQCPAGEKACSVAGVPQCVGVGDPAFGCGEQKNCLPCEVKVLNAVTSCDLRDVCAVASCKSEFRDCNSSPSDGCEINTGTDAANCRDCGHVCPTPANSTPLCLAGTCSFLCAVGHGDCNLVASDGCEVDLTSDPQNCKRCKTSCAAGQTCVAGVCT
jgi:hypothetical protein